MAFIVGGLLGGGIIGNLAVAAIGIGINLAISYFFPQKIKGPRAESLKAQTSKYGDNVARIYGTNRTAGAIIWLKDDKVDEHVSTERQGKALGPEVTTYSYTATFAVVFAYNGPFAAVSRIWADDKLIYDNSPGSTDVTVNGATFTIYLGTDTQGPDPDIEADRGAGNVPAYPGDCYVVIKDLPLDEFGIRIPNVEAELVHVGEEEFLERPVDDATAFSPLGPIDVYGSTLAHANAARDHVIIEDIAGTIIADVPVSYNIDDVIVSVRGDVLVIADTGVVYAYDAATGALKQTLTSMPGYSTGRTGADISIAGVTYFVYCYNNPFRTTMYSNDGISWTLLWSDASGGPGLGSSLSIGPDYIYIVDSGHRLYRIAWTAAGRGASVGPITISGLTGFKLSASYDDESDSVIVIAENGQIFVMTPDLVTIINSTTSGTWGAATVVNQIRARRLKSGPDRMVFFQPNTIYEYRVSDLALLSSHTISEWGIANFSSAVASGAISSSDAILVIDNSGYAEVIFLPRVGRGAEPLADVIEAECRSVGLIPDVSLITTDIWGYGDRNGSAPRGVIEDLQRVNFFDWAQVDGLITFFPRNTVSIRTLSLAETGMAFNAAPEAVQIKEEYPAALDIPEQVIISYISYDAIYRTGSQAANAEEDQPFPDEPSEADADGFPVKTRKKRVLEFATSQVLKDDDAAKVADTIHNDLRDAATVYKTTVGPKHLDLYPGLVIEVPLDDTRVAKSVITKMSGETIVELELRKRGDSYESVAVGQPTPYVVDSLLGMATAVPVLIDGHLMRAEDDNDAFYAGIAVTSAGQFRSGTLFQSEDGGTLYSPWAAFTNGTIRGFAVDVLPDRPHADAFDRTTSFTIAVAQGTAPDSVTEEALLAADTTNGFAVWNASVSDWEYIRAASVVDNLDNTWTLSTLLRGRKGTEFAMAGHAIGDLVYHLDLQAIDRATDGDRTLSRLYVAVPSSTRFNSAGAVAFTNTGKGLRPWAPAFSSAVLDSGSGDWTFTWNRRDRLGQDWPEDDSETPPMSEDTEEYTVNIYDGVGVLVNTYTASSESYVYTAADQTTDFGSPQTSIEFGIAQVSAIYGDGVEMREAA